MPTFFRNDGWVKATNGPAVPGAQIFVCSQPANVPTGLSAVSPNPTPLATIYSDPDGLVPITQPIITDGFGHYDFYVLPGTYDVSVYLSGKLQQEYPDQSIGLGSGTTYTAGTGITIVGTVISATSPGAYTTATNWSSPHAMLGAVAFSSNTSPGTRGVQTSSTMSFWLPVPVSFNRISILLGKITSGSSQDVFDWGIYDLSGNLKASIGATTYGASATPTLKTGVVKQGTVTLQPGPYIFYWADLGGGPNTTILVYTTPNRAVSSTDVCAAIRIPYNALSNATDGSGNLISITATPPTAGAVQSNVGSQMDWPVFAFSTV